MNASGYAFVHGIRSTRATLTAWNEHPFTLLRAWFLGSLAAQRTGISRWLHERAGRLAILFVIGATAGSLGARRTCSGPAWPTWRSRSTTLALPILTTAAVWEVYVAPHVLAAVI